MKRIKQMIESAPTAKMAREMLNAMRMLSSVTEEEYEKGRELIKKEFEK